MFIGVQVDAELAAEMDRARRRKDRSQFIREAIAEKLDGMGVRVREELIYPPPRAKVISAVSYSKKPRKKP